MYYKYMEDVYIIQLLISVEVKKGLAQTQKNNKPYIVLRHKEFYPTIKLVVLAKIFDFSFMP